MQHAILERAGLGLVGVADEVVGRAGWSATASHLRPVGKAAPPRPTSFEAGDLVDDASRAELEGPRAGRVAARSSVVVQAGRVDRCRAGTAGGGRVGRPEAR